MKKFGIPTYNCGAIKKGTVDVRNKVIHGRHFPTKEEIERMPDLNTLILDRNPLDGFPRIESNTIGFLSLIECGLTREDVDISGLTSLSPHYFFLTEEDYKKTFGE